MSRTDEPKDGFAFCVTGQNDAHRARMTFDDLGQQLRSVHPRHHHVRNDNVHWLRGHEIERFLPAIYEMHVPLKAHMPQLALQSLQHLRLVIHK